MREKKIYCTSDGWGWGDGLGCPYFFDGECSLEDPMFNCISFNWDPNDNYYADEPRTAFGKKSGWDYVKEEEDE